MKIVMTLLIVLVMTHLKGMDKTTALHIKKDTHMGSGLFWTKVHGKPAFQFTVPYWLYFVETAPAVGLYQNPQTKKKGQTPTDHNTFRWLAGFIELNPAIVIPQLPPTLQTQLAQALGMPKREIGKKLLERDIRTYATVHGIMYPLYEKDSFDKAYNMFFHAALPAWDLTPEQINKAVQASNTSYPADLVKTLQVGIFDPQGLRELSGKQYAQPIAFEQWSPVKVVLHKNGNLSPNTGKFGVQPERAVATFWSAALSPDKQHSIITYHIMGNTPQLDKSIFDAATQAETIGEFIQNIRHIAAGMEGVDGQVLAQGMRKLESLVTGKQPTLGATPPHVRHSRELLSSLKELTDLLGRLTRKLI